HLSQVSVCGQTAVKIPLKEPEWQLLAPDTGFPWSACAPSRIILNSMSGSDSSPGASEVQRKLAELYAGMSVDELREIAAVAASPTENAREALRTEISRRGLAIDLPEAEPPAPHPELRELVLLRRFGDLPGALLARSILESAGIEC